MRVLSYQQGDLRRFRGGFSIGAKGACNRSLLCAGLAAVCRVNQTSEGWVRNTPEISTEAVRLARQAIDMGKDDPEALLMGAHAIGTLAGDITTANIAIDRALALNPNAADAWNIRGWLHLYVDQADSAIEDWSAPSA